MLHRQYSNERKRREKITPHEIPEPRSRKRDRCYFLPHHRVVLGSQHVTIEIAVPVSARLQGQSEKAWYVSLPSDHSSRAAVILTRS